MATKATVQLIMPEMGESVTEGTVLEWHVSEGDSVEEGQTMVEVSTDKVDAEVPAPASGTVSKILVQVDEEIEVGKALAEIDPNGAGPTAEKGAGEAPAQAESAEASNGAGAATEEAPSAEGEEGDTVVEVSTDKVDAEVPAPASGTITKVLVGPDETIEVGKPLAEMRKGAAPSGDGGAPAAPAEPKAE